RVPSPAAGDPRGVTVIGPPTPRPVPLARQRAQLGLEAVMVSSGDLLVTCHIGGEALDEAHRANDGAPPAVQHGRRTDGRERDPDGVHSSVTIERLAPPSRREVAPFHQLPGGVTEACPRAVVLLPPPHLVAQHAPYPWTRSGELCLEPAVEDAREEP